MPQIFYRAPSPAKPKAAPSVMKVRQHRPWICPLAIVLTAVASTVIGRFLYYHGTQAIIHNTQTVIKYHQQELEESHQQLKSTQQENVRVLAQNKELRAKLAMMVRTTQEGQETYANVLNTLSQLQKESSDLTEELSFYKRLLTSSKPSKSSMSEVVMTHFTLGFDEKSGRYPLKMILTQWTKEATVAQGIIQIHVLGQSNGKNKRLTMKSITKKSIEVLKYEVHYFQRIEDELQLPKEFIPEHMIIRLLPKGQKKANEIKLKWKELLKQEQS
ncbi:MAG TPA: hypothetical protein ENG03_02995 [Thioploca sp.]|nr:MAG: hypothetical protein DRR08_17435 [Gammaproteobacteria bacterium]HDN26061.1 hypothetical protein [Thioploca sp.]